MILSVELTCFGQHVHTSFVFTEGLNTIRGKNEKGKSTIIYAILYALWGARVLPMSLDDTVSWGHPVGDLKVRLTMMVGDQLYLFTRGKSGAECEHSGGRVTGQTEVSRFASELLGADNDKAFKLMVAPQNALRGALTEGATALSAVIEEFSGMDLFDMLLEAAGDQLTTGPTTALDLRIAQKEEYLEKGIPAEPDLSEIDHFVQMDAHTIKEEEQRLALLVPELQATEDLYNQNVAANELRSKAEDNYLSAWNNHKKNKEELHRVQEAAALPDHSSDIVSLETTLVNVSRMGEAKVAKSHFDKLVWPEVNWEGSYDSLLEELTEKTMQANGYNEKISGVEFKIKENEAHKITSSKCGFCEKDFSQIPEVKAKNDAIDEQVKQWRIELAYLKDIREKVREEVRQMTVIRDANHRTSEFYGKYHAYVEVTNDKVVPREFKWNFEVKDTLSVAAVQRELDRCKREQGYRDDALAKLPVLQRIVAEEEVQVQALKDAMQVPIDLVGLQKQRDAQREAVFECQSKIDRFRTAIQHRNQQRSRIIAEHQVLLGAYKAAEEALARVKGERKELVFNNNLVKKIKAARPIVASKLWGVVLASVSSMFSDMRGEKSVVARTADNFTVNGKPIKGLSGSAQDILGMALRVALLKSFVPGCPFMILDEPMAACDNERTEQMLQFINTSKFKQVILVTHEDISADWADHNVTI